MSKISEKPKDLFILEGINVLAFNNDFTQCALSKKDSTIYIYQIKDLLNIQTWELIHKLQSHTLYISSLDWNPKTNKILSCSHDKTAYVWTYKENKWESSNVVASTKLGYLTCCWNKIGNKFALGTSSNMLLIGYYDEEAKWWTCKPIKKLHKSSVTTVKIDCNSLFVLSGSTDMKVYITSCYMNFDNKHLNNESKQLIRDFGTVVYKFKMDSWVNSVNWSNDGNYAFASGQNSNIVVIDYKNDKTFLIKHKFSPINMIIPIENKGFYAVGFDRNIFLYELQENNWNLKEKITKIDENVQKESSSNNQIKDTIKKIFENPKKENLIKMESNSHLHPSLISSLNIKDKKIITSDVSGFIKFWNF